MYQFVVQDRSSKVKVASYFQCVNDTDKLFDFLNNYVLLLHIDTIYKTLEASRWCLSHPKKSSCLSYKGILCVICFLFNNTPQIVGLLHMTNS